ncbi:hypothetical protein DPY64_10600 [Salmonella enterica subsp. enterica serovar Newport]|nr:hypothetical protein [Salmonella enterica subsp. enterica serovar Newport]
MNHNLIWRVVASSPDTYKGQDEQHVFVDAPDYEHARERVSSRLAEEWGLPRGFIDTQLREMSTGPRVPAGLPLPESGRGNGEVFYDQNPLILVASPGLREVPESALQEVKS